MKGFLGYALGVLTVGVFLIAYGVLVPRTAAFTAPGAAFGPADQIGYGIARPVLAGDRVALPDGYAPAVYNDTRSPAFVQSQASAPRAVRTSTYTPRPAVSRVESGGRTWQKTAMVIGGSSAAGAGIGALVGGKKGALIGAAIGAGASSLYEAKQR
jgi:hypothetical protein